MPTRVAGRKGPGFLPALRPWAKKTVNRGIAPLGIRVVGAHDWSNVRDFIPFERTLAAAERAGLSVCDYIDGVMNRTPGATQGAIDEMSRLGVFAGPIESVVEIGPGSGRYLEKTLKACAPAHYNIYETSRHWADYVVSKYKVALQPTDGKSLRATPDASTDLVQAHKVFSSIPFVETCGYWMEMARATRRGGHVVFDIMTEACLDPRLLEAWTAVETGNGSYPAIMPRSLATEYFTDRGFVFVGSAFVPMWPGRTELFVFRKT